MCEKTCYKCRGPEGGKGCRIKATQSRSRTCSAAANKGKTCPSRTNFWEKYEEEKLCEIPKCACMYTLLHVYSLFREGQFFLRANILYVQGGFHLVAKIIRELKSHMIPYKFKCSHWLKLQHSDWRANHVKDFFYKLIFHQ